MDASPGLALYHPPEPPEWFDGVNRELERLSPRDRWIIEAVAEGLTTKQVAMCVNRCTTRIQQIRRDFKFRVALRFYTFRYPLPHIQELKRRVAQWQEFFRSL